MITIDMLTLLRDAQEQHHAAEQRLPKHPWEVWYAAYVEARIRMFNVDGTHWPVYHADTAVNDYLARQASADGITAAFNGD